MLTVRVLALSSLARRIASPLTAMASIAPEIKADWLTVGSKVLADDELEAVIFDCDGTLVDSMGAWIPSWKHACSLHGLSISEARFWGFAGVPLPDIVLALYQDKHGADSKPSEEFVAQFLQDKRAFHTAQEEEAGHPPAIKCVTDRIHYYKSRGIKVAVASSGLRDIVERHCEAVGILSLFDAVVVAAEVPRGKPWPDVFEKAAELLGANPAKCRAYEDGESGLESAWRAQMHVVDVREMAGYPLSEGLRAAMIEQRAKRDWSKPI